VSDLLIGVLSALLATNQPAALSNLVVKKTGLSVTVPDPNDPVEREFHKLMADDDAAQAEVDQWIQNRARKDQATEVEAAALQVKIRERFDRVKTAYETFLQRNPKHAGARLAYGSFLNDIGEEEAAHGHWEKARELDPANPAAWNNLANWYGHNGPVTNAFAYYAQAIALDPTEPVYFQNFATTVYLFRRDATNFFKITEQEVFERAMQLYRKALELDPKNFLLATDYAQSYYGFKPAKSADAEANRQAERRHADEALVAWQTAFKLAGDDIERQGVLIHFARIQINAGRLEEARQHLGGVTNSMFNATKQNLTKKLERLEAEAKEKSAGDGKAQTKP
jgi:tetratricopeptide (TPR) repeat protein